jgi:hypothetical protein
MLTEEEDLSVSSDSALEEETRASEECPWDSLDFGDTDEEDLSFALDEDLSLILQQVVSIGISLEDMRSSAAELSPPTAELSGPLDDDSSPHAKSISESEATARAATTEAPKDFFFINFSFPYKSTQKKPTLQA